MAVAPLLSPHGPPAASVASFRCIRTSCRTVAGHQNAASLWEPHAVLPWCCSTHRRIATRRAATASAKATAPAGLSFRPGAAADVPAMRRLIWAERMNPLGIAPERFTVAVDGVGQLLGFGQLEQKDSYVELRSMVVDPSARRQGVGRALLQELLHRAGGADVLLTTISSRIGFYAAAGFRRLDLMEVPRSLLFEVVAGTAVARLAAGEELVVLKREMMQ